MVALTATCVPRFSFLCVTARWQSDRRSAPTIYLAGCEKSDPLYAVDVAHVKAARAKARVGKHGYKSSTNRTFCARACNVAGF